MNIKSFETYNSPDEVYSLLNKDPETKKLVSMFVNVFAAQTAPSTHLKESWKEEIGTTISEDACVNVFITYILQLMPDIS